MDSSYLPHNSFLLACVVGGVMEIEIYADVNPEEDISELFTNSNITPLEDEAYREELVLFLKVALSRLNKKEREVILYRFGFKERIPFQKGDIPTQREVAPEVGFESHSGVDFVQTRALNILWRFFKRAGVEL